MESTEQIPNSSNKNALAIVTVGGLIVVVGLLIYKSNTMDKNTSVSEGNKSSGQVVTEQKPVNTPPTEKKMATNVKEFTVRGGNFKYDVDEIKVKKGDTVKIKFINDEGFHDWVVDEFNAKTKQIKANEEETIEFVADKTGTFEYYCSVGKHREMGMKGNLIVE